MQKHQTSTKDSTVLTLEGYPNHKGRTLAWSPDGAYLASAYAETSIEVWNPSQEHPPTHSFSYPYKGSAPASSPDGRYFATAQYDGVVLWETETGSAVYFYAHGHLVEHIAWSPDGKRLATVGDAGLLSIWEIDAGCPTSYGHSQSETIGALVWSPDGNYVLSAGGYDRGILQHWDASTGHCRDTYDSVDTASLEYATALVCSPDGKHLLSGHSDGTLRLWSTSEISCVQIYHWHACTVTALAWSPEGTHIVSGFSDGAFVVANVFTGIPLQRDHGSRGVINALNWSRDGTLITSISTKQSICVWNALTGEKHVQYEGHPAGINALSWSPEGTRIASQGSGETTIQIWNAQTGVSESSREKRALARLTWSPESRSLTDGQGVWNGATGQRLSAYDGSGSTPEGEVCSPNGKYGAVINGKRIDIYTLQKRTYLHTFTGHTSNVQELVWSVDGERIASVGETFPIYIWEAKTGKPVRRYSGPPNWLWTLDWSPDTAYLACGGQRPTISLFETASGELHFSYEEHTSPITVVRFAPKEHRVASASLDRTVHVWQAV